MEDELHFFKKEDDLNFFVKNQLWHAHKSKDDRKQTKTTGLISKNTEVKRWPCVNQIYLVVQ